MPTQTQSELEAELVILRARRTKTAGIKSTSFSDQSTTFDQEGLDRRIADLERQLAVLTSGRSTTRYAATAKGC